MERRASVFVSYARSDGEAFARAFRERLDASDLQTRPSRVRVPFMVEDLAAGFVPRAREFDALAAHVVDREREAPITGVAVLCGPGGYGKTALARALCHDETAQNAFDDGVPWVTLGENTGQPTGRVEDLTATLSGQRPGFVGVEAATAALADRYLLGLARSHRVAVRPEA